MGLAAGLRAATRARGRPRQNASRSVVEGSVGRSCEPRAFSPRTFGVETSQSNATGRHAEGQSDGPTDGCYQITRAAWRIHARAANAMLLESPYRVTLGRPVDVRWYRSHDRFGPISRVPFPCRENRVEPGSAVDRFRASRPLVVSITKRPVRTSLTVIRRTTHHATPVGRCNHVPVSV
jgi:hypothetical protein